MSVQQYLHIKFKPATLLVIQTVNEIVTDYVGQGFRLTVRQIYYQMVARDLFPAERKWTWTGTKWVRDPKGTINADPNYKWLCAICDDARYAGLMDWDAIEDRTRAFVRRNRWDSAKELLDASASQFHMDMWKNQAARVFVIVEKEALAGVLERVCHRWDIPLLAARGYPSSSVLREFAIYDLLPVMGRMANLDPAPGWNGKGFKQQFIILHLGDHDPSGLDMSSDLAGRLALFCGLREESMVPQKLFTRIALNMDQIEEMKPPENPAKTTDARYKKYQEVYGDSSWELDALKPDYLDALVERHTKPYVDMERWEARKEEIAKVKKRLRKVAEDFA